MKLCKRCLLFLIPLALSNTAFSADGYLLGLRWQQGHATLATLAFREGSPEFPASSPGHPMWTIEVLDADCALSSRQRVPAAVAFHRPDRIEPPQAL